MLYCILYCILRRHCLQIFFIDRHCLLDRCCRNGILDRRCLWVFFIDRRRLLYWCCLLDRRCLRVFFIDRRRLLYRCCLLDRRCLRVFFISRICLLNCFLFLCCRRRLFQLILHRRFLCFLARCLFLSIVSRGLHVHFLRLRFRLLCRFSLLNLLFGRILHCIGCRQLIERKQ